MIRSLTIKNWKAFEDKHITFDDGVTFLVGPNGVGKTTLLEAICLAVTGRTMTADFQKLVRQPDLPAEIRLEIDVQGSRAAIRRVFRKDRKLTAEMVIDSQSRTMSWDDLTSQALDLLSVDEMFFNRLTYMSEGEVFQYLHDPPGEALNSRIQEIYGIANLQILEGFIKGIRRDYASSIRETSAELKTISTKEPLDESQITTLDNYLTEQKEKEKDLYEKRDMLSKEIQELEGEKKNYENLRRLLGEIDQGFKEEIAKTAESSLDLTLAKIIKTFEAEIASEEKSLRENEALVGSVQNRITYLKDIERLLQSVIAETAEKADFPCPVCKRPIDKPLADRLIGDTEIQISQAEKELFEAQKTSKDLQVKLSNFRERLLKTRAYETRLKTFPNSVIEPVRPLSIDKMDTLLSSLKTSLQAKEGEAKEKTETLQALRKEIESKTHQLANIRAEMKQMERMTPLRDRLRFAYEGEMSAEIIAKALTSTLHDQKDQELVNIYEQISELWNTFRPESKWQVVLDDKGVIRITSKERQYDFSHLSGGEKTVLLVLARVILSKFLAAKIDFLMIDEPLEHLDIRNRRSLLNFLVEACRKNFIPQMLVTTFEETLVRRYYEGEKTRTEVLA